MIDRETIELIAKSLQGIHEETRKIRERLEKMNAPDSVNVKGELQAVLCVKDSDGRIRPLEIDPATRGIPISVGASQYSTSQKPIYMVSTAGGS